MYRHDDPRFRRTLNQITSNLETANENAQFGLYSFSEHYVKPCFGSVADSLRPCLSSFQPCVQSLEPCWTSATTCLTPCLPRSRSHRRLGGGERSRGSTRGRLETSFDFYDDWEEEDENDALLGLGNEEFERVVGPEEHSEDDVYHQDLQSQRQPGRRRIFDYGAAARGSERRRSNAGIYDAGPDPTVILNQSYFGFLSKLPFGFGGVGQKRLRYKPSAANLQEQQPARKVGEAGDALLEDEEDAGYQSRGHGRQRSGTTESGHTTDSLSSRGDLFPSDEEDDAVPLDDTFEHELAQQRSREGRDTNSGRSKGSRANSSALSKKQGQKSPKSLGSGSRTSKSSSSGDQKSDEEGSEMLQQGAPLPTVESLKEEERRARSQEEEEVEKRRDAALRLAREKELSVDGNREHEVKIPQPEDPRATGEDASEPFPNYDAKHAGTSDTQIKFKS